MSQPFYTPRQVSRVAGKEIRGIHQRHTQCRFLHLKSIGPVQCLLIARYRTQLHIFLTDSPVSSWFYLNPSLCTLSIAKLKMKLPSSQSSQPSARSYHCTSGLNVSRGMKYSHSAVQQIFKLLKIKHGQSRPQSAYLVFCTELNRCRPQRRDRLE